MTNEQVVLEKIYLITRYAFKDLDVLSKKQGRPSLEDFCRVGLKLNDILELIDEHNYDTTASIMKGK